MRHPVVIRLALIAVSLLAGSFGAAARVLAADPGVEVTSTLDLGGTGGAICPHAAQCTLRRAIEVANADATPGTFAITFAPAIFPEDAPATIFVGNTPLPNVSRAEVAVDGSGAGVVIEGAASGLSVINNGLTVTEPGFSLRRLRIHNFAGSCLAITGAGATAGVPGAGNTFGGCKTGVAVSGANAVIAGNLIGFNPEGGADEVESGIVIAAGGAVIGGPATSPGSPNVIGFADVGIFVGSGSGNPFTGVSVERNSLGRRPNGEAAPVTTGIVLSQPSSTSAVSGNEIHNVQTGILVRADSGPASVVRSRFASNVFEGVSGLAIDLGGDGVRNPNDAGDEDLGPNGFLNFPEITRATQTRVSGRACAGCQVQVYLAAHEPGGERDYGRTPLPGGVVTADSAGQFALDNPAASAGDWLVALATDADGNTSEFGTAARVGSGAVLCGNVQLQAGWNHVGYFGPEPVALLSTFAPDPSGTIVAIYRTIDGSNNWEHWFSASPLGRTLQTVQPGESYWMFASAPVTLAGGFSISFPVPVALKAGFNDLTYLGATAHVLDALASLGGAFRDLYRYDSATESWLRFGDPSVPAWAQDFTTLEACGTYQIRLDSPATLVPLQP